jgi:hypothetical protein
MSFPAYVDVNGRTHHGVIRVGGTEATLIRQLNFDRAIESWLRKSILYFTHHVILSTRLPLFPSLWSEIECNE